jgi:hypothetical protein
MTSAIMTILIPASTGYGGVRHIPVSLPRVDFLLADQPAMYALPTLPGESIQPDIPARRGARWTAWDHRPARRHREQRELAELAEMLGDPV